MGKDHSMGLESMENMNREQLLNVSSWLVESLRIRLAADRFREREGDSIKLQYLRVLVQALQAHNSILKDAELEEIKNRLQSLEVLQSEHKNN